MAVRFSLNGVDVDAADESWSLLDVLRDRLGVKSTKDGCSPQGQCGCCTVLVDGQPRVACVTPVRRVAGRAVTTVEGMPAADRDRWADALVTTGGSQCGFCTPGILLRLHATAAGERLTEEKAAQALLAHLCRCTGWRPILEAAAVATGPSHAGSVGHPTRTTAPREAAAVRAHLEGGVPQRVGRDVVLGAGGFADDTAPPDALVAVPSADGGWSVGESLAEARKLAGKVQGRRTTMPLVHPLELPPGDWAVTLRTAWVEPAYLEPDASWCVPGGEPASPVANGGAFGGKLDSPAPAVARRLADEHGRAVRVVLSREDVVRLGPKRPPVAAGLRTDGSGVIRVARTDGIRRAILATAPALEVEEVEVPGPPTSARVRAAGWAEAAVLTAAVRGTADVSAPNGSRASAVVGADGGIDVRLACGDPLDETVLRSYAVGAAHMGLGWVTSEGIAIDDAGHVQDLTIRSFGILRARDTPEVRVIIEDDDGEPRNGSDAVFAAVAAAAWIHRGLPPEWPTERGNLT